eukprot:TRINITY_DN12109_c0_g1_i10.p2 TRINITY_DN12109_c0_g1~~TRINITY_DN12109_c0_g1_i10.p2  ORF type:complete len:154 (+),score=22.49 TRINITY_DN12109_c0_g1_i10:650-1111(+)
MLMQTTSHNTPSSNLSPLAMINLAQQQVLYPLLHVRKRQTAVQTIDFKEGLQLHRKAHAYICRSHLSNPNQHLKPCDLDHFNMDIIPKMKTLDNAFTVGPIKTVRAAVSNQERVRSMQEQQEDAAEARQQRIAALNAEHPVYTDVRYLKRSHP